MTALSVFVPLQKVDLAKRQVWGVAALEQPDRSKPPEIMDYERSKPRFLAWSESMQKASRGLSLGNVRAQHGGQLLAVGRVIHLEPRDAQKEIYVGVEVVDDAAWDKVQKGVYTGFSVGGSYGDKWADSALTKAIRYDAIPEELSLVDRPCMPGATFDVIKADGTNELRKFVAPEDENKEPPAEGNQPAEEQPPAEGEATPESNQPAPEAGSDTPAAESAEETPESAPSGAEGAAPENQQASLNAEAVKEIVVGLLMDLGLVQPAGAQPMSMAMRMDDLQKQIITAKVGLTKMHAAELQKAIDDYRVQASSQLEALRKTVAADLAQVVLAVQELEKRGGQGPVIRDLGAISPQVVAEMQKASVLKDLLKETSDPLTRQKLQEEITRLEIKAVQTQK
jgi:hypothetical protein